MNRVIMKWFNEPAQWSDNDGQLNVRADGHTDFWRITGYGYVRDNAHIYGDEIAGDFSFSVRVVADYTEQYDQAGVAIRLDDAHWIKTGVEKFDGKLRFSTVVTVDHSNWVVANLPEGFNALNLSLERTGDAVHIRYSVDEEELQFASVVYLAPKAGAFVGVMCASPEGDGLNARFSSRVLNTFDEK
jgi:regulation of enolase protein 1 (concanavalin A-like superfamily)